jgi:hypothetical protein
VRLVLRARPFVEALFGPFRYAGTRSDDPNDIVAHQNRRDLRGLYVFCAWLNHTDAKSINSMDSLVVKPIVAQLVSFGFYAPAWMRADFPHVPAIGNFEYRAFDAEQWHSNYQNTAFELRTPGDTYWAAKKVTAFSDNAIRAIPRTGQYEDARAVEWERAV